MWSRKRALSREGRNDTKNNYANPTKPVLYCGCLPGCGGATNAARIRQSLLPHCGGYRNNPDIFSVFHLEPRERGGFLSAFRPLLLGFPPPGFDTPGCRPDGAQTTARAGVSDVFQDASGRNDGPNAPHRGRYPVPGSRDEKGPCVVAVWIGGLVREKMPLFRLLPRDRRGSLGSLSRALPARGGTAGCGQLATWGT